MAADAEFVHSPLDHQLVGMVRCAVTVRVQRAERTLKDVRIIAHGCAAERGAGRRNAPSLPAGGVEYV